MCSQIDVGSVQRQHTSCVMSIYKTNNILCSNIKCVLKLSIDCLSYHHFGNMCRVAITQDICQMPESHL